MATDCIELELAGRVSRCARAAARSWASQCDFVDAGVDSVTDAFTASEKVADDVPIEVSDRGLAQCRSIGRSPQGQ